MNRKKIEAVLAAGLLTFLAAVSTAFAADGWQKTEEDKWVYYEADAPVKNKWIEQDGHWMHTNGKGEMVRNGSFSFDGKRYAFDSDGYLLTGGWVSVQADRSDPSKAVRLTWYYADSEGVLLTDGWHEVDGCLYYFNASGAATTNGVATVGEDRFYVQEGVGRLGTTPGWFSVDVTNSNGVTTTYWYYAKNDGSLYYGGWFPVEGHTVYFDKSCRAQLNKWFKVEEENILVNAEGDRLGPGWCSLELTDKEGNPYKNWYYIYEDMSRADGGFREIDGSWYFFDKNGLNFRDRWYVDPESKARYYLDENGVMKSGWFSIDRTNAATGVTVTSWYYADESGSCYVNGDREIDGKTYYFSASGVNLRNRFRQEGKRRRFYGEDGALLKDQWFSTTTEITITGPATMDMELEDLTTVKETWYYADGEGYVVTRTDQEIGGQEYRINKSGVMVTGWQRDSMGDYTYYGEDGAKVYGWLKYEIPAEWRTSEYYSNYVREYGEYAWFYLDPENEGKAKRNRYTNYGEVTIEEHVYSTDNRGMIMLGWSRSQPQFRGLKTYHYYMPEAKDGYLQGERVLNSWVYDAPPFDLQPVRDKTWFYIDEYGNAVCADENKKEVKTVGGYTCLFDEYGRTLSGLSYKEGKNTEILDVYYFDPEKGNSAATGLTEVTLPDGRKETYLFASNGIGVTGEREGYLYYKGRRQVGSGVRAVTYSTNEDSRLADVMVTYLVDADGKILKNASGVTSGDAVFSSNEKGNPTSISGASEEKAVGPSFAELSHYIGEYKESDD